MWEEILRLAVGNGLWAVLFCVLLFYLIKDSKRREEKYCATIDALCDRLKAMNELCRDITEIKELIADTPLKRNKVTTLKKSVKSDTQLQNGLKTAEVLP